ncbi:response regulator transcription factor [Halomonas sp. McH1-25]|uniref:response regulator n=1 Tax=unclassified Halomonas TaxID=2609666 RepID=UPI001EF43478|nr:MULTISPECIES: response regulator transcription factor [unclassified Halomonas]MCG7602157.1 response regulator transcription factor [Halomonas sp. McH1-25]MCP1344212.1 response regulator transcription factor [Halomonas sp. FL8]MCP1360785.1 response regulator transcription factor [Halomonas sp. BBD45]MCP1365299.1 response regulator transcription factor [Halomonas sp. BBD48]
MVRVFVVEDHPLMRDMLTEFLALEEIFEVVGVVDSAEAALERFPDPLPDLVLIDMSLPGMSGIDLLRKLHERQPGLPCAMLSGHGEKHYVEQAFEAGASGYILKGEPDELPQAIQQILAGKPFISPELQR